MKQQPNEPDYHIAHNKQLFNSFTDLLERVVNDEPHDLIERDRASRDHNAYFNGTYRIEDALTIATGGWEDGRNKIYQYAKEYGHVWRKFFPQQNFSNKITTDVTGDIVLIEKFLCGDPEDMMTFKPDEENYKRLEKSGNGKLQRIILNGVVSSYINIETIFNYGALIAALVQTMEESGFSVELDIVWKFGASHYLPQNEENPNDKTRLTYILQLKRFSETLDVDKLGFCVAHSSMLRRFIFSLMECEAEPFIRNIVMRNYGYPINLTPEEVCKFGASMENNGGNLGVEGNMYFRLLDNNYTLDQLVKQCTAVVKEHFTEVSFNDGNGPLMGDGNPYPNYLGN